MKCICKKMLSFFFLNEDNDLPYLFEVCKRIPVITPMEVNSSIVSKSRSHFLRLDSLRTGMG